jgi:hypothetical protein
MSTDIHKNIEKLEADLCEAADNLRAARDFLLPRLMNGETAI